MSTKQMKKRSHSNNVHIKSILSSFKFLPTSVLLNEEVENTFSELNNTKELSLILQALTFLYHGRVCFDFDHSLVSKSAKFNMSFTSDKKEDGVLIFSKDTFSNHSEFLGSFAQQLARLAMTIVFKNDGLPYYRSDPKKTKEQELAKIAEDVFNEVNRERDEFDASIVSVFCGSDPRKWHQELIIKVPYLIAKNGNEEMVAILSKHESTTRLLEFYLVYVSSEIQKFVAEGGRERNRQDVYSLNRKLGLLKLYQKNELKMDPELEVNIQGTSPLLVYCSSYPYLSFMRIASALNCREPTNNFYVDNVFSDLDAFYKNHDDVFQVSKQGKTLFLVYPDDNCPLNDLAGLLERFIALNRKNKVILIVAIKIFKMLEPSLVRIGHSMILLT